MSRTLAGWVGALSTIVLCASCESNASNPTVQPLRLKFAQTESGVVYVAATDTVISVYNDQEGIAVVSPTDPNHLDILTPGFHTIKGSNVWIGQTFAGYSVLSNFGQHIVTSPTFPSPWEYRGVVQPVAPSQCAAPPCPLILRGDPGVATNGKRVLYSNLAYSDFDDIQQVPGFPDHERGPNALAIAIDENGLGNFGTPFVVANFSESQSVVFVDQPSISMLGDTALAGFDDANNFGGIYLVTTDDSASSTSWYPPQFLALFDGEFAPHGKVTVKLASPTVAYLAYIIEHVNSGGSEVDDAIVTRLTRAPGTGTWSSTVLHIELGASMPDSAPGDIGRNWADLSPMSFDIGRGGTELHLVLRRERGNTSDIVYVHCLDVPLGSCDSPNNFNWVGPETFPTPQFTGSRYQPWVTADPRPSESFAAISWYQQLGGLNLVDQFYVLGVTVGDSAPMPHVPEIIGYKVINRTVASFAPCPGQIDPLTGLASFGDYESSTFTPYPSAGSTDGLSGVFAHPLWMSTFAHSLQCLGLGNTNNDAHIEASAW